MTTAVSVRTQRIRRQQAAGEVVSHVKLAKLIAEHESLKILVLGLAEALHQHARNDCAPDLAIPFMRKLAKCARKIAQRQEVARGGNTVPPKRRLRAVR